MWVIDRWNVLVTADRCGRSMVLTYEVHWWLLTGEKYGVDINCVGNCWQVWKKYGVTEDDLYIWTEKLRKVGYGCLLLWMRRLQEQLFVTCCVHVLSFISCLDSKIDGVGIAQLAEHMTEKASGIGLKSSMLTRDFSPRVNFLCRLLCIDIRVHIQPLHADGHTIVWTQGNSAHTDTNG